MKKSYAELLEFLTFEERFDYLAQGGVVGNDTFGSKRYLNQKFYRSKEWRSMRDYVIARDEASDLGVLDRPIRGKVLIHHINSITPDDIQDGRASLLDPNNLISVSHLTHNALHYGDKNILPREYVPRSKGDTTLW